MARPSDPDTGVRTPEPTAPKNGAKTDLFTAPLTIDVTPELRGRIKVTAFERGITTSELKTGAPVRGEDASRWIVPIPGHPWPKALSLARRVEPRRAARRAKRKLHGRKLDD